MDRSELPKYICHKIVRAAKITAFRGDGTDSPNLVLGEVGMVVLESAEWYEKHKPQVGGYYIVYEDGYRSFSPAQAFERGYSRFDLGQSENCGQAPPPVKENENDA